MLSDTGYHAVRHAAGLVDQTSRGRILATGAERLTFLHGLLTNDIAVLSAGTGCYAAYLTPQGRLITDMKVLELGDAILLDVPGEAAASLVTRLEQLIFSEAVQVQDASGAWSQTAVHGPQAPDVVARAFEAGRDRDEPAPDVERLRAMAEFENGRWDFEGSAAIVAGSRDLGAPGFDIYVERPRADALRLALTSAGATPVSAEAVNILRIEAGRPLFGVDMDTETIPLEAGLEDRALSFTKGCYVGQEVIIRVMHRGHGRVARKLVGLTLDGDQAPAAGASIVAGGKEIGHVTSAARSPALERTIALGYVARDFVNPGTVVQIDGRDAVVTLLPFVRSAAL